MKILSWNCRGLSKPTVVRTLRRFIRDQSPDILFILETKISWPQVSATLNRLGFFLMSQVVATGTSGGLVLSWRPGVDLECFVSNKNNISTWCFSDCPQSPWILSCVCGPLIEVIEWLFRTPLLLLEIVLKPLGCALGILTLFWFNLRNMVEDLLLALLTALSKDSLTILV
jgi:hypothetical protein